MIGQHSKKITAWTIFAVVWLFFSLIINSMELWQGSWWEPLVSISPELIFVMLCFVLYASKSFRYSYWRYVLVVSIILFLGMFRVGDFLVPKFFERKFSLYIDTAYIPDLLHLLYHSTSLWQFCLGLAGAVIALVVCLALGAWLLKQLHQNLQNTLPKEPIAIVFFVLWIGSFTALPIFSTSAVPRVWEELEFVLHVYGYKQQYAEAIQEAGQKAENLPHDLAKLKSRNVYLFIVESYGYTVLSKPEHLAMMQPNYDSLTATLQNKGFQVCSNFLVSPTYGGNSWLTHGTLACGVKTHNQIAFDLLMTSKIKSLAGYLNDAGYRTVSVMPGTTKPLPEDSFFRFQKKYYTHHFDYEGPKYGWATMTDQYVVDFIRRQEITKAQQPLFIEYVLISSHAPFHQQPTYIEDWEKIQNGKIYNDLSMITFPIVWPDMSNASEGYMVSIKYVFQVLEDYIANYIDDDSLIIIMGDHQPHAQITGKNCPWSVPIHIISRDQELLSPFMEKRGYTEGIIPKQKYPHRGIESFLFEFLEDFSHSR